MTASSRTPEGSPNRCPVCAKSIRLEPSANFGDAPCPNCAALLWFVVRRGSVDYFDQTDAKAVRDNLRKMIAQQLGVSINKIPEELEFLDLLDLGADSLDTVELVMELEEKFGIKLRDDDDDLGFPPIVGA